MFRDLINTIIYEPFLNLLVFFYGLFEHNLGVALILLAITVRLLLIPFVKRQTEMTRKMQTLKPEIEKLKKKYKNNQEEFAKAQMKLYQEKGYNPLGCLFTLVPQLIIGISVFGIVRAVGEPEISGLYGWVENWAFGSETPTFNTDFFVWDLSSHYNEAAENANSYFDIKALKYLMISLAVGAVQFFSMQFTTKMSGQDTKKVTKKSAKDEPLNQEEMAAQMSKSMLRIFPLITVFITLSAPLALAIYWIAQSLMFVVQYFIIDKEKALKGFNEILGRN